MITSHQRQPENNFFYKILNCVLCVQFLHLKKDRSSAILKNMITFTEAIKQGTYFPISLLILFFLKLAALLKTIVLVDNSIPLPFSLLFLEVHLIQLKLNDNMIFYIT